MNMLKKITALLLAVLLCCSVAACGGTQNGNEDAANSNEAAYKVTLVNALGQPYTSGVVVKFMQNGQQVAMQVPNESGVAEKTMVKGDYTVELQFTGDGEYAYDLSAMTLSAEQTELTVELSNKLSQQTQTLGVRGSVFEAHYVSAGCTQVELDSETMSYFLFAPTEPGTYEFSLIGSDAAIGYYGMPHFVQENSAATVENNKFTISVRESMIGSGEGGTSVMVIGVAAAEGSAVLAIDRIGDPEWTVEDEPWTVYEKTVELAPYSVPAGAQFGEFDLTAASDAYKLVLGTDGFYHLDSENGPLVLMKLGKTEEKDQYVDAFEVILEHTGVVRYFFDDNGEFVKKERYSDCLLEYIACVDEETGLYPLTEDLKYILQQEGEDSGWWDPESSLYLFVDENGLPLDGINNETAWLFMCRYMK